MAENKKISELTRVSSLTGAEIVPFAKDGSNGAVTTAKLKEYAQPDLSAITTALGGKVDKVAGKGLSTNDYTDTDKAKLTALPTKAELDSSLGSKLDKSEWYEEHVQFGRIGYYLMLPDKQVFSPSIQYYNSGLLPINRQYDIVFKVWAGASSSSIAFFEADGSTRADTLQSEMGVETTVTKENIPSSAVYFAISTPRGYAKKSYYRNGPTQEAREGAVADAIQASKMALFIDQWNAACGSYGKYNADTGYFELNGLVDITYKEAVLIYANRRKVSLENFGFYGQYKGRTNLMPWVDNGHFNYSRGMEYMFSNCTNMEVARVSTDDRHVVTPTSMFRMFIYCGKLRKVLGVLNVTATTQIQQAFEGCAQLQEVQIRGLKIDLSLSDSPLLSLDSLSYLVAQSAASKPITVTVHPEVYAKLTATEHSAQARSNLALNSDVPVTSASYPIKQYLLNTVLRTGTAVTITVWGTPSDKSHFYALLSGCDTDGHMVEISSGVWQKTLVTKNEVSTPTHLNIYNYPNNKLEGHIDKVKICFGLDPNPQWTAPAEMPTDPEAIEAIGWERVMLMAAAKQINFATT